MNYEELLANVGAQRDKDILQPLIFLRVCEARHRKMGGAKPECIKLAPDYYDKFIAAYKHAATILRAQNKREEANQLDIESPHLLGLPIVCDPAATDDIVFYVAPYTGIIRA